MSDAVRRWGETAPERTALVFLEDGEHESARMTYGELHRAVVRTADHLAASVGPGGQAVLCFPSGTEFVVAFLACLAAGIVAVPVSVPQDARRAARLDGVLADCAASALLTDAETAGQMGLRPGEPFLGRPWATVDAADPGERGPVVPGGRRTDAADTAFLQYTSGSTGSPKGVVVTHDSLGDNIALLRRRLSVDADAVVVSWLPVFHDMGLIGGILTPVSTGATTVLMPPSAFLRDPLRWLRAVTTYRSTATMAPNFGYEVCLRRATVPGADLSGIDLSSLVTAGNGAEPIRASTMEDFARFFRPMGFRRSSFHPGYGLAEATLYVSGRDLEGEAGVVVDGGRLREGFAVPAGAGERGDVVVDCGPPGEGQTVAVVHPESGRECPSGEVGEIWVAGRNVSRGYWDSATGAVADATVTLPGRPGLAFRRTGDLGFLHEGGLYVTGRLKDVIVIGGSNHYPQDVEATVERLDALRPRGVAAFPVAGNGTEGVGIAAEVVGGRINGDLDAVARSIAEAVWDAHEVGVSEVALLKPGHLPKTTSGKVRRRRTRELLETGALKEVYRWSDGFARSGGGPAAEHAGAAPNGASPAGGAGGEAVMEDPGRLAASLLSGSAAEAERIMVEVIRAHIVAVLGLASADLVPADSPPQSVGLDSLNALELSARLSSAVGFPVGVELLRTHRTPAELGPVLLRRALVRWATSPPGTGSAAPVTVSGTERGETS
ncbi:AMP-binding protein [Streptomyces sp. RG38]|uniref:AMP-binding protein n=1 Tax=Streptomyces tagetis TaxID=2820809 RepID=A0A940XDG0_9ACTN|nr:AMP-binding protein [Streptomyces sp. RG38]